MTVTAKSWTSIALLIGGGSAVVLCVINGFIPGLRDISDPLGRPSSLSAELINSAGQFDTLTSVLVPKHEQLAGDIQTLRPLADNLESLTDRAGALTGSAQTLNASTANVNDIALPLPSLITDVIGRANTATPTVAGLSTAVRSVAGELQNMQQGLGTIETSLGALGPKASDIAATLAVVREEAAHVREFGPLLAIIGPPVNALNLPPLSIPAATPSP